MKFDLTEQELQVISEALGNAPYARVAPVVMKLQQQINAQLTPTEKSPTLPPQKE